MDVWKEMIPMKKLCLIALLAALLGATATLGPATAYAGNHCQGHQGGDNDSQGDDNDNQ